MINYTSNEQYEKDKAKFIADIERFAGIQKMLHGTLEHREAEDLANLLKQSKWINAYPTADDIKDIKKAAYEDGYHSGYSDGEDDATDYFD